MQGDPAAGHLSDDDLMARLEAEMGRPPFHAILLPFAKSIDRTTGEICIGLAYRPEFSLSPDRDGYHGGVLAALVDIAGHAAVAVQLGRPAPTIDIRIDFIKPAPPTELTATSRVLRLGRSLARADIEVRAADGSLVVVGRGAFSTL
jgi:uncharacterized protein (TIGR00369 family)